MSFAPLACPQVPALMTKQGTLFPDISKTDLRKLINSSTDVILIMDPG
jgi:hypothetical protein